MGGFRIVIDRQSKIKSFGFTLNESVELLDIVELNMATCEKVSNKVTGKIALIEQKIKELEELKAQMVQKVNECHTYCAPQTLNENCPILTVE